MIGRQLVETDGGARWRIVAAEHGQFVIAPLDHGVPETVTLPALAARFGVDAELPPAADEQAGWERLAQATEANDLAAAQGVEPGPTPEQVFAAHADD